MTPEQIATLIPALFRLCPFKPRQCGLCPACESADLIDSQAQRIRELEAAAITDAAEWLETLEIGENQEDDPDGPFTPSECALGRSLFEYAMRDRAAVTSSKIGTWNPDWDSVRCGMQFGWYSAARELLRSAQAALRSESHQASADDPSAPSGVDEAVGEHLAMTEGEGNRRLKAMHYNVHDPQPGEGKDG